MWAAGDGTQFPVKQGGVATQQADAVAAVLAARAGARVDASGFEPVLRGKLMTGAKERFLRANPRRDHGTQSEASTAPLWWPPSKIAGRYLAPYLAAAEPAPPGGIDVEVPLAAEHEAEIRRRVALLPDADGLRVKRLG